MQVTSFTVRARRAAAGLLAASVAVLCGAPANAENKPVPENYDKEDQLWVNKAAKVKVVIPKGSGVHLIERSEDERTNPFVPVCDLKIYKQDIPRTEWHKAPPMLHCEVTVVQNYKQDMQKDFETTCTQRLGMFQTDSVKVWDNAALSTKGAKKCDLDKDRKLTFWEFKDEKRFKTKPVLYFSASGIEARAKLILRTQTFVFMHKGTYILLFIVSLPDVEEPAKPEKPVKGQPEPKDPYKTAREAFYTKVLSSTGIELTK